MNRAFVVGDVFRPILPLLSMLDDVPVVTLSVAIASLGRVKLTDTEMTQYKLPNLPSEQTLSTVCDGVLEYVSSSKLLQHLPPKIHGIDSSEFVGALAIYTMESPYPFYRLLTIPLNVQGVRNRESLSCQLPFLKLLTLALRAVPRNGDFWFEGPLYRGVDVDKEELLKAKYDDFENAFAPGTKITFAAPTSTSFSSSVANHFTHGIQYVIQGEKGQGGPGGVYLKPGEISVYEEAEVLLEAPFVCEVVAATKPENTVIVVLRAIKSKMTYLSGPPTATVSSGANILNAAQCNTEFEID